MPSAVNSPTDSDEPDITELDEHVFKKTPIELEDVLMPLEDTDSPISVNNDSTTDTFEKFLSGVMEEDIYSNYATIQSIRSSELGMVPDETELAQLTPEEEVEGSVSHAATTDCSEEGSYSNNYSATMQNILSPRLPMVTDATPMKGLEYKMVGAHVVSSSPDLKQKSTGQVKRKSVSNDQPDNHEYKDNDTHFYSAVKWRREEFLEQEQLPHCLFPPFLGTVNSHSFQGRAIKPGPVPVPPSHVFYKIILSVSR